MSLAFRIWARFLAKRRGDVTATPQPWTLHLFAHSDGDRDPECGAGRRDCGCGAPHHVIRLFRPPDALRYDGEKLSETGPWAECRCGRWKEAL